MPSSAPLVLDDPGQVGHLGAELVANRLRCGRPVRLLLPTGRTPAGMYEALRAMHARGALDTAQAEVVQIDEYEGLGPGDARSFAGALRRELGGLGLRALHLLDGAAPDLDAERRRHAAVLDAAPVDLAVLGLGRDGHVAFVEPGGPTDPGIHRVALAALTVQDAAAAFGGAGRVPPHALTVGLGSLRRARAIVLLATGAAKAEAVRAMLEEQPSPDCPASLLRDHPRLLVVCDRAAAGLLTPAAAHRSDRALVVLGHREPTVSPEHRISDESRARVRRAADIARDEPVRLAVLTGWTSAGGLSEAEQLLGAWDDPQTPAVPEVAGRDTAENATRSLPLLLACGVVRRVTVVTSAWHVRARFFFAPYRRHGLVVDHRSVVSPVRGWPPLVATELRLLRAAPAARRRAYAALERGGA